MNELTDLSSFNKIHFVGIGGISMSGLAEILLMEEKKVSGSDKSASHLTKKLSTMGAEIFIGHDAKNITDADLIVHTAAVKQDNPELVAGKNRGIKIIDRAALLGSIMHNYKKAVAVSGTHGKTTTTSILSHILLSANVDPTISIGGELKSIDGNIRVGKSDYFVTEACEYHRSFLKFYPYIAIILNVDADHLDFFKDLNDIKDTFKSFSRIVPKDGFIIVNADDKNAEECVKGSESNIYSYSIKNKNASLYADSISFDEFGYPSFEVYFNNKFFLNAKLNVLGMHNVSNSLAAICAAICMDIDKEAIVGGLKSFTGTKRRFDFKGKKDGVSVIDDYAHHPTEILATLNSIKNYPHKSSFVVFQPHTYTRTLALFDNFVDSLKEAENLITCDIYAAREKDTGKINSYDLSKSIPNSVYLKDFEEICTYLKNNCSEGDIIVTMGAGDVYKIGDMFLK